ncbi:MAG: hypothetical protein JO008_08920 [Alphaproteobacteria bacterium]|nr:hypothetical protein [Alphaproteobacteria bacterium]
MTEMIAHCTQGGQSNRAITWASDELEGFMHGSGVFRGGEAIFPKRVLNGRLLRFRRAANGMAPEVMGEPNRQFAYCVNATAPR